MLTVAEAAIQLHVHPNTLRRWTNTGVIRVYHINSRGDRRFNEEDINRYLAAAKNNYCKVAPRYLKTAIPG